jgi:glycosyltransferase involved in cell wall biosynthesis
MDISIVVCTYNRCETLRKVLRDLNKLRIPEGTSCEVLVVDNNSNDGTRAVVEEFVKNRSGFFKYIFESRRGKSSALNTGVNSARGEVIAFTDDDVTVDGEWLAEIEGAFESYGCMGIGGKIIPVWNCERPQWFEEEGPYSLYAAVVKLDLGDEARELQVPAFGANMAFRRTAFEKYGLFREDLGPNPENLIRGEDSEFSLRVIRGGEKFMYVPTAVVYHPVEEQRTEKKYFQKWYFDYGRSKVRKQPISDRAICYKGVPKYLIRMLLEQTVKWILSLNPRRRFYYKLQAYEIAGEIAESYASRTAT